MEIYCKNIKEILKHRKKLESMLKVQISTKFRKVTFEGEQADEYLAREVFDAIAAGFPVKIALLLADMEYILERISIKNLTKRQNLKLIRARIIGHNGETIELIGRLADCFIKLHENIVYIIGHVLSIKIAINAVEKIIQGSKQSSVYAYLEKQRGIEHPDDLGLKIKVK